MNKLAFIFPGQGAQTVGMGKDLYENFDLARRMFEEADDALGFSIKKLCFEGPADELMLTANTQPAILTVSVIAARLLMEEGVKPDIAAGHSLGEYSALVTAGVMDFADAVRIVNKRGQYMQEAVPVGEGGMAAILGIERDKIIELCAEASQTSPVQAVNFNCPGQTVIAGAAAGVEKAVELCKAAGAKMAVILPVSAPFHSTLMKPAAEKLAVELDKIEIREKSKSSARYKEILEATNGRLVPEWLEADKDALKGTVKSVPTREIIDVPVNEMLIVELYSK